MVMERTRRDYVAAVGWEVPAKREIPDWFVSARDDARKTAIGRVSSWELERRREEEKEKGREEKKVQKTQRGRVDPSHTRGWSCGGAATTRWRSMPRPSRSGGPLRQPGPHVGRLQPARRSLFIWAGRPGVSSAIPSAFCLQVLHSLHITSPFIVACSTRGGSCSNRNPIARRVPAASSPR